MELEASPQPSDAPAPQAHAAAPPSPYHAALGNAAAAATAASAAAAGGRVISLEVRWQGGSCERGGELGKKREEARMMGAMDASTSSRLKTTTSKRFGAQCPPLFLSLSPPPSLSSLTQHQVENFKSYRGRQRIGPFGGFTAVIGPNGSGKSNLMDALSFVLGVRARQLRGGTLRDLLHSSGVGAAAVAAAASEPPLTRARVELVFRPGPAHPDAAKGDIRFARVVVAPAAPAAAAVEEGAGGRRSENASATAAAAAPLPAATSHYEVNGRQVTWDAYDAVLRSHGILVKARNFLVFQGDIESVASASPQALTAMFEAVSGSGELKAAYEEAEAAKASAEEAAALAFSKRRAAAVEKRLKREQRDEAEKFLRLQRELDELRATLLLLRLFHADADGSAARLAGTRRASELADVERARLEAEASADLKRKDAAELHKQRMLRERSLNRERAALEARNPEALRAREESSRLARREKELAARVVAAARARDEQAAAVAKLEADLRAVEAAQEAAAADEEAAAAGGAGGSSSSSSSAISKLDAATRAEYYRLKEEAGSKTARVRATRDAAAAAARADASALSALEAQLASLAERGSALRSEADAAAAAAASARADVEAARRALREKEEETERLRVQSVAVTTQRLDLERKLNQADEALRDARAQRRETERDRRAADAVAHMRRLFPGVHGRVTDLASARQRRHQVALAVVLGKDMDSVVVDTEATAKECIAYLKQARAPPMTFLPVATIRAKPVNERLRARLAANGEESGGANKSTATLAIDLLDFEPSVERALASVCGDTLVCDSVAEARSLAFMGAERHKVVALDGTLISRAGLITGGASAAMDARAARWDDAALAKLKEQKAAAAEALAVLPAPRETSARLEALAADRAGLEREAQLRSADADAAAARASRVAAEAAALEEERGRRAPDAASLQSSLKDAEKKAAQATERINEVEDRLFAVFSSKVGVPNVREHMERSAAAAAEASRKRLALEAQLARIRHQLSYERRRDLAAPAEQARAELDAAAARRAQLADEERSAAAALKEAEAALSKAAAEVSELRARADAAESSARDARRGAAAAAASAAEIKAGIAAAAADAEAADARARDVLEAAEMEQVALPLKESRGAEEEEEEEAGATAEEEEAMDTGEGDDGEGTPAALRRRRPGARHDFSRLPRALTATAAARPAERERADAELRREQEALAAQLARGAPNLKAPDQYLAAKDRERALAEGADAARARAAAAADTFARVRAERALRFSSAFEHAASAVDDVFKDLTKSDAHPAGGSAYLSLEHADEPYLGGVRFVAMPPAKRYRDMDALSGGEKTLSALALLFAVHSFQAAPFFVLDEVDAALDAANVARVARYVRAKTREGGQRGRGGGAGAAAAVDAPPLQAIVISLKDGFYHHADALVGVCRDPDTSASGTLTFDLDRFGEP